jgi:DNA-binding CsgD family transcriptional regulator
MGQKKKTRGAALSQENSFLEIAECISQSAFDESLWNTALEKVALALRSDVVTLIRQSRTSPRALVVDSVNVQKEFVVSYNEQFAPKNPCHRDLHHLVTHTPVACSHKLIPDSALSGTEFYQAFLRPQGLFYGMTGYLHGDEGSVLLLTGLRPRGARPYKQNEAATLKNLLTPFSRAYQFRARVRAVCGALDSLSSGVFILDGRGRIQHANASGAEMLESGSHARIEKGQLRIISAKVTRYPLGSSEKASEAVFVEPLEAARKTPAEVFGWTPAESRVAHMVSQGATIQEVAERLKLSQHTARNQLKQAMRKAGARRQLELAAMIWTCHKPESC